MGSIACRTYLCFDNSLLNLRMLLSPRSAARNIGGAGYVGFFRIWVNVDTCWIGGLDCPI